MHSTYPLNKSLYKHSIPHYICLLTYLYILLPYHPLHDTVCHHYRNPPPRFHLMIIYIHEEERGRYRCPYAYAPHTPFNVSNLYPMSTASTLTPLFDCCIIHRRVRQCIHHHQLSHHRPSPRLYDSHAEAEDDHRPSVDVSYVYAVIRCSDSVYTLRRALHRRTSAAIILFMVDNNEIQCPCLPLINYRVK